MKHQPRKRFGQNFLTDQGAIDAIIDAIHPQRGETVVEIGPGLGALTRPLLAATGRLHAIEIDRDLAASLRETYGETLDLHVGDVLDFDFSTLGMNLRIVGNLPYNISTPLLFRLADFAVHLRDIHVMLQKEVVERMVAQPGDSEYSRLTVMLQYRFSLEKILDVPAASFYPVPQVDSAVVRLMPLAPPALRARDDALLERVVTAAFSQRRKTLRNSLRQWIDEQGFETLGIAANARAQELSVAQFVALADYLAAQTQPRA